MYLQLQKANFNLFKIADCRMSHLGFCWCLELMLKIFWDTIKIGYLKPSAIVQMGYSIICNFKICQYGNSCKWLQSLNPSCVGAPLVSKSRLRHSCKRPRACSPKTSKSICCASEAFGFHIVRQNQLCPREAPQIYQAIGGTLERVSCPKDHLLDHKIICYKI